MDDKFKAITILLLGGVSCLRAQEATHVFSASDVGFFGGDTVTNYGNFINDGASVYMAANANVIFYGDTTRSASGSSYSGGGKFHFTGNRPAPYAGSFTQYWDNSAVKMVDVLINNNNNVHLANTDAGLSDTLTFVNGILVLNQNDLTVGSGTPGAILGYDQNKYVYTNGNPSDTKGYLTRESVGATNVVFPVSSNSAVGAMQYAPAQISNAGTVDNFSVRAFPGVLVDGTSGGNNYDKSNNQTWDIKEGTAGGSNVTLTLQHMAPNNGPTFSAYNTRRFISHFVGTAPNNGGDTVSNTKWTNMKLSSCGPETSPGTLTTGSAIIGAEMLSLSGVTSFSPFAKTVQSFRLSATPLNIKFLKVAAKWSQSSDALVSWTVDGEEAATRYEVWRKVDKSAFAKVGELNGRGSSTVEEYSFTDFGIREATQDYVYYKIAAKGTDKTNFSNILMLKNNRLNANTALAVYPNPSNDKLFVDLPEESNVTAYELFDVSGKRVKQEQTELGDFVINVVNIRPGIYYLRLNIDGQFSTVQVLIHR